MQLNNNITEHLTVNNKEASKVLKKWKETVRYDERKKVRVKHPELRNTWIEKLID